MGSPGHWASLHNSSIGFWCLRTRLLRVFLLPSDQSLGLPCWLLRPPGWSSDIRWVVACSDSSSRSSLPLTSAQFQVAGYFLDTMSSSRPTTTHKYIIPKYLCHGLHLCLYCDHFLIIYNCFYNNISLYFVYFSVLKNKLNKFKQSLH